MAPRSTPNLTPEELHRMLERLDARLDGIEKDLSALRIEYERVRGVAWALRWIVGILGLAGMGTLLNWLSSQGK